MIRHALTSACLAILRTWAAFWAFLAQAEEEAQALTPGGLLASSEVTPLAWAKSEALGIEYPSALAIVLATPPTTTTTTNAA